MEMMKAMKKLKFWSRKKRKKTRKVLHEVESNNPPSHRSCSSGAEPSAPPLPPWLELHWEAQVPPNFPDGISHAYQTSVPETYPRPPYVYHQYAVPDHSAEPAHGKGYLDPDPVPDPVPVLVPVMAAPALASVQRKKSAGLLGCVFNLGVHVFHCFFPCFRIREETFPLLLPANCHT